EMENNSNTKPIKNIKFLPTTDTTQYILGRVLDNENIPLESANITLKGNKIGTSSDREGKFKIMVPDSVLGKKIVLIVSYAGFETQEINISTKSFPIDIAVNLKVGAFLGEVTINKKPSLWERIFMKK
ncbi:MAG TPA: carboxypeptidase-like regulatory domain-containing protein, partial [Saprospiraceae bacterium]|nr:carboxypeptidase-like regulatory domain-containing protein [Saprospiraceae bacterium]